jgi:hypothetical protein
MTSSPPSQPTEASQGDERPFARSSPIFGCPAEWTGSSA